MKISVIIPAKDAEATLGFCLEALKHQQDLTLGIDYEVIVVDDGSMDATPEVAAAQGAIVIRQENAGPASARNHGARAACGEILVFTDADCVPAPDWLTNLVRPFENEAVVGVKGAYLSSQKEVISRFVQLEYESKYHRMLKLPRLDSIDTNSAAYRRAIFMQNGGFELSFSRPSVEDQEFAFRLSQKGYLLVFAPSARIYHCHDRTIGEYFKRKFQIGYWKIQSLRWHPEKTFTDTQSPVSQRLEIILLGLAGISAAAGISVTGLLWMTFGCMVLFYATSWRLLQWIARKDPFILTVAPLMLLIRALALGSGLFAGLVFSPHTWSDNREKCLTGMDRAVKRCFDLAVSTLGLLLFSPIFLVAGLAFRMKGAGRAFTCDERVGENGKIFCLAKFGVIMSRFDEVDSESGTQDLDFRRETIDGVFISTTRRVIHHLRLEKLPQLWNVLRGEMSLVGPNPEEEKNLQKYTDAQRECLSVKPGLFGPDQRYGKEDPGFDRRMAWNLNYVHNYSFWLDLAILAKGVRMAFSRLDYFTTRKVPDSSK